MQNVCCFNFLIRTVSIIVYYSKFYFFICTYINLGNCLSCKQPKQIISPFCNSYLIPTQSMLLPLPKQLQIATFLDRIFPLYSRAPLLKMPRNAESFQSFHCAVTGSNGRVIRVEGDVDEENKIFKVTENS